MSNGDEVLKTFHLKRGWALAGYGASVVILLIIMITFQSWYIIAIGVPVTLLVLWIAYTTWDARVSYSDQVVRLASSPFWKSEIDLHGLIDFQYLAGRNGRPGTLYLKDSNNEVEINCSRIPDAASDWYGTIIGGTRVSGVIDIEGRTKMVSDLIKLTREMKERSGVATDD